MVIKALLRKKIFFKSSILIISLLCLSLLLVSCGKSDDQPPAALNPIPPISKAFTYSLTTAGQQIRNYAIQNGQVPEGEGVQVLFDAGLRTTPSQDSWGTPVQYEGHGNSYRLASAGPDKQWGTEDDIVITEKDTPW